MIGASAVLAGLSMFAGGAAFAAGAPDDDPEWVLVDGKCVPGPQIWIDPPVTDEEPWPDEVDSGTTPGTTPGDGPQIWIDPPVTDEEPWPDEVDNGGPGISIDPPIQDEDPWVTDDEIMSGAMMMRTTSVSISAVSALASNADAGTVAAAADTGDCVEPTPAPTSTTGPTPVPTPSSDPTPAPMPTATPEESAESAPRATDVAVPPVANGDAAPSSLAETGAGSPSSIGVVAMILLAGGGVLLASRRWLRTRSEQSAR